MSAKIPLSIMILTTLVGCVVMWTLGPSQSTRRDQASWGSRALASMTPQAR